MSVRLTIATAAAVALIAAFTPPSLAPVADVIRSDAPASPPPSATPSPQSAAEDPRPHRRDTHARPSAAERVLGRLSLPQRVGQLFMVGTPATSASPRTLAQISRFHVGNVMLTGRSYAGTRTPARVAAAMQARATDRATGHVRLLVATDQEGGAVQVLHGRGIDEMPAALAQGRWTPARLERAAGHWARQLRAAGVNLNLAPVTDTVPGPTAAAHNPPIGGYDREFGYSPRVVARHGVAFARGMTDHGVLPTVKHFPGLGRVHANTDERSRVTDRVTRRHDPYLEPFRRAVDAGVPVVMMSTAYYSRLDRRNPAAFSRFVIRTMLRGDLGFRKVVISDDLGSARQVAHWSYGARAVRFLGAGGDLVLTVDPSTLPAMYDAVLRRARTDRHFRELVDRSALRVLEVKADRHLLGR
ncbi:glycoside hydrolase family 3 protein [Nocardioides koreensis]|uniref:beta-N-acetylhexosaminidase n=1 Tax=Nocardioides koreensis TaxID=433651 RepID=A0ABN3A1W3_9ACTN